MQYKAFILGPIETNAYVLHDKTGSGIIVDPAEVSAELDAYVSSNHIKITAVVLTHSHVDHIYAAPEVCQRYGVPAYLHEGAEKMRGFFRESCLMFGLPPREMIRDYRPLNREKAVAVGKERLSVMTTPGHSPCGVSLYCGDLIVTGDVLFKGGMGRYDLPQGSLPVLYQSLKKIIALPGNPGVLPGHGPETTLDEEKRSNEFVLAIN